MYQSLANLIRWSDQVMLEGVNSEDKEMVTTVKGVIKAVLDGVKVRAGFLRSGQGLQTARWPRCVTPSGVTLLAGVWSACPESRRGCQKQSAPLSVVLGLQRVWPRLSSDRACAPASQNPVQVMLSALLAGSQHAIAPLSCAGNI